MNQKKWLVATLATVLGAAGCASGPTMVDVALAREAESLELRLDENGALVEIEYHVKPEAVPIAVRSAFHQMNPGVKPTGAEREFQGGQEYWELKASLGSLSVEAMFLPDGTLHSEEREIETNAVPAEVRGAIDAVYSGAGSGGWEQIRDASGNVKEFHVKFEWNGKAHKIAVSPQGEILWKLLEIPAEFEVPAGS